MFKIFENYTIEDVPSVVKSEMITTINTEGTEFNSFLLKALEMLTDTITALKTESKVASSSSMDIILAFEYTAKNLTLLIEHEEESFKIVPSELEGLKLNCQSILNAVGRIKELQANNIKKLDPEELLVVLTT